MHVCEICGDRASVASAVVGSSSAPPINGTQRDNAAHRHATHQGGVDEGPRRLLQNRCHALLLQRLPVVHRHPVRRPAALAARVPAQVPVDLFSIHFRTWLVNSSHKRRIHSADRSIAFPFLYGPRRSGGRRGRPPGARGGRWRHRGRFGAAPCAPAKTRG